MNSKFFNWIYIRWISFFGIFVFHLFLSSLTDRTIKCHGQKERFTTSLCSDVVNALKLESVEHGKIDEKKNCNAKSNGKNKNSRWTFSFFFIFALVPYSLRFKRTNHFQFSFYFICTIRKYFDDELQLSCNHHTQLLISIFYFYSSISSFCLSVALVTVLPLQHRSKIGYLYVRTCIWIHSFRLSYSLCVCVYACALVCVSACLFAVSYMPRTRSI